MLQYSYFRVANERNYAVKAKNMKRKARSGLAENVGKK